MKEVLHSVISAATIPLILNVITPRALGAEATTSPGNNSVFVAHQDGFADPLHPCCARLDGTITSGRANGVLMLAASFTALTTDGCSPTDVDMFPRVNGISMKPDLDCAEVLSCLIMGPLSAKGHCDMSRGFCPTITGTYWLDLDQAEAGHPGMFIGQPLNITLLGRWFGANCSVFTTLTMSAELVSK
jgi:hypothetical protein